MVLRETEDILNPPGIKVLAALYVPAVGGIGTNTYSLWRDWQHRTLNWVHLCGLLICLYMVVVVSYAVRQVRNKLRGGNSPGKNG